MSTSSSDVPNVSPGSLNYVWETIKQNVVFWKDVDVSMQSSYVMLFFIYLLIFVSLSPRLERAFFKEQLLYILLA